MRKIKEILRLHWQAKLKVREIARSCGISHSTVREALKRAQSAQLSWPLPDGMDDTELEAMLYRQPGRIANPEAPDMNYIHRELASPTVHVTRYLLWQEYKTNHPDGLGYSQFCEYYRRWQQDADICMRQVHRAGEKMFVDFSGDTVAVVVNRNTGEVQKAEIFIAVLGASNYTYARACWSQDLPNWIDCHCRAFAYFGGVTRILVPDNPKAGVKKACYYEPDVNPTYQEMATYYGTVVIPTRPRKPQDKAKVENGVLNVERRILATLRNRTFFSLNELNEGIAQELEKLNNKPFQKMDGTRRSLYEAIDKPALLPLPTHPYEYAEWKKVRANIDYHVEIDSRLYSVPYQLRREEMDARITASVVEVFCKGKRVASHPRCTGQQRCHTELDHMPSSHRAHAEWTPSRLVNWGTSVGNNTGKFVQALLDAKPHPEQGYRSCLGIIRLFQSYGANRVEAACGRALVINAISYHSVKSILKTGLDQALLPEITAALPIQHENLRGSTYYAEEGDSYVESSHH